MIVFILFRVFRQTEHPIMIKVNRSRFTDSCTCRDSIIMNHKLEFSDLIETWCRPRKHWSELPKFIVKVFCSRISQQMQGIQVYLIWCCFKSNQDAGFLAFFWLTSHFFVDKESMYPHFSYLIVFSCYSVHNNSRNFRFICHRHYLILLWLIWI